MINGICVALINIFMFYVVSRIMRNRIESLKTINVISYYWFMFTILTGFWELCFICSYKNVSHRAVNLIDSKTHVWTNDYNLSYILPWKMAQIFYAEYGAWADREYMTQSDDWSRVIESSHALMCGLFSLGAILSNIYRTNNEFLIMCGISMGSQLMNSILYMANYFYQVHQPHSVNYNTPEFPTGILLSKRIFMYINYFWMIMPLYTIVKYILLNKTKFHKYKLVSGSSM